MIMMVVMVTLVQPKTAVECPAQLPPRFAHFAVVGLQKK